MRKRILFILVAGALAVSPVLAHAGDAGTDAGAPPRQFGSVVGVPPIWPKAATDAGTRDAGTASSIQW